jgi:CheY-like chemotaxis protein
MGAPVVLVLEDNAELRTILEETLGAEGYSVHLARDEAEALAILRAGRVDLLISDLSARAQTAAGLESVRREFPRLQVVALAADTERHPDLFAAPWQAPTGLRTLPKPFRLGELLAVSREVLGAAR